MSERTVHDDSESTPPTGKLFNEMHLKSEEMIFHILQFCDFSQIISSCIFVSKQWMQLAVMNFKFDRKFSFSARGFEKKIHIFKSMCKSRCSQMITSLTLSDNLPDELLFSISNSHLSRLTSLELYGFGGITVTSVGLQALGERENLKHLENLVIDRNEIRSEGFKALAESKYLTKLTHVRFFWTFGGAMGAKHIAASPNFANLTSLSLNDHIRDEGFKHMCESPYLSNLTYLDIGQAYISNVGMKYLADSIFLTKLSELVVDRCKFDATGVKYLCDSNNSRGLTSLRFEYTQIGDEAMKFLALSPNLHNLEFLDIKHTNIGNVGAKYLAESSILINLKIIEYESDDPYYEGNSITEEGIVFLQNSPYLKNLCL